jgi:hypothetical protein
MYSTHLKIICKNQNNMPQQPHEICVGLCQTDDSLHRLRFWQRASKRRYARLTPKKTITTGPPTTGHRHHRSKHRSSDFRAEEDQREVPRTRRNTIRLPKSLPRPNHNSSASQRRKAMPTQRPSPDPAGSRLSPEELLPGWTFARSFWTSTSRNWPEPAHATTEPHTPDVVTAPTPCQGHHQPRRPDTTQYTGFAWQTETRVEGMHPSSDLQYKQTYFNFVLSDQ